MGAPWGLVFMENAHSAGAFPHIHRAWVTEVCLSLDTLFWAEVGGGIIFVTSGGDSRRASWITQKSAFYVSMEVERCRENNAVYASLGGTAQSPWP